MHRNYIMKSLNMKLLFQRIEDLLSFHMKRYRLAEVVKEFHKKEHLYNQIQFLTSIYCQEREEKL